MSDRSGWMETEATVFTCGVKTEYHVRLGPRDESLIVFGYTIGGHYYSGEFVSSTPREEGTKFQLLYDPDNPENYIVPGQSTRKDFWQMILWLLILAALGLYELLHHHRL